MQRSISARMIALHIEDVLHALAVRKRWRIEKNQVVDAALGHRVLEPGDAIGLDELVVAPEKPFTARLLLSPIEVGGRHVDGRGCARAARRGIHRGAAGVGEQIEEAFARGGRRAAARASCGDRGTGRCRGSRVKFTQKRRPPSSTSRKSALSPNFSYWSPRAVLRRWRRWMNSAGIPVAPGSAASASLRRRCTASGSMVFGAAYSCTYSQTCSPPASA